MVNQDYVQNNEKLLRSALRRAPLLGFFYGWDSSHIRLAIRDGECALNELEVLGGSTLDLKQMRARVNYYRHKVDDEAISPVWYRT